MGKSLLVVVFVPGIGVDPGGAPLSPEEEPLLAEFLFDASQLHISKPLTEPRTQACVDR